MNEVKSKCVYCNRSSSEVPLINFEFKGHHLTICSQHLPVLIHDPAQLVGKLPGAEGLDPADHHD